MSDLQNCHFMCIYSNNTYQKTNMRQRFAQIGIDCNYHGIPNKTNAGSIEYTDCDHLQMIFDFYYTTTKAYGVFCEAEIYIHKDLRAILTKILSDFSVLKLDILLLGYHVHFPITESMVTRGFPFKRETNTRSAYTYHDYPDDLVGNQMYILSRKHAKYLLDKYYTGYIDKTFVDNTGTPFSSTGFIITREGNKALISPAIVAVCAANKTELRIKSRNAYYNDTDFI
jgi:hypothetical protein